MIANYHTHTFRCGHAEGDVRDYAAEAERAGLKILGVADHTPYDFFDIGPRNRPMRMKPEELPEYAEAVRAAAKEYEGRMEMHLGVEAEYYPKYFSRLVDMLREHEVEYMILGQHFLENEVDAPYCGRPWSDAAVLERYVAQSIEALQTRLFTYFAHPDLINFPGQDDVYEREIRKLCRAAYDTGTPLEIHLLGLREGRNYPDERFWRIAGEEGNAAVLGCDAHQPPRVSDPATEKRARELAARFGLPLLETVELRGIGAE
ncbi:MAG: histidinol-phosphatase [Oscillospiraceae bacterium]|nr:histidinol-phosphatase [Oscillospiraceae bacterium]